MKVLRASLAALILTAGASAAEDTMNSRIIIVGEDRDIRAVPRSDDSYGRVVSVIQNDLAEAGYFVIDEQLLSAKLGVSFQENRRRQDIVEPLQAANEADDPSIRSRLAFVFSIIPVVQGMTMTNHVNVRVRGDIFDLSTMRMLRSAEVRTDAPVKLPSDPLICGEACLLEAVGNQAVEVADELADQLIVALDEQRASDAAPNLYRVSFSGLEMMQAIKLVSGIKKYDEVTGANLIEDAGDERIYGITTSYDAGALQEAVLMSMLDVGLDVEGVKTSISGTELSFSHAAGDPEPGDYLISLSGYDKTQTRNFGGALIESFGTDAVVLDEVTDEMRTFKVASDLSPLQLEMKLIEVLEGLGIKNADTKLGEAKVAITAKEGSTDSSKLLDPAKRDDARVIQAKLKEAGFYTSVVDGLWGKGSREALKAYKAAQSGLPDDAEWDMETQASLKP